jgi:uncharacterized integral membrane protein
MTANVPRDDGRKINVKLILVGAFAALLVVFALLNTHDVGIDWIFDTATAPMILVIAVSAVLGFVIGFVVRSHVAGRSND